MKKRQLLKTMLLLFALIVGVGNSWAEDVTYKLTISTSDFNSTSYAANNNEKTSTAVCTTNATKTYEVKWTSNQIMNQSSIMQWQKDNGYLYNSTDLGTITSVTIASSEGTFTTYYGTEAQPSTSTTVGGGFFQIKVGDATGKTSKVEVTFTISEGPSLPSSDLALTNAPIDLSFDLYTNPDAQTISYTTSSTGKVTVSESDYITSSVDQDNKTITITPKAVTPSVQTITVSQVADDTYASGSVTFTVSVANSADYATLPFEFKGGKTDIESTAGLTHSGLGSDYSSSPKLKFDTTGDYLILKINEAPGTLTFDIKGNGFSGGTFTVQTSVDGETFTDLKSYTELGTTTQSESFGNLAADVRYIKWIYTTKVSGNVALGNIKLAKPDNTPSIAVEETTINVTSAETEGTINVTYNNITDVTAEVYFCDADGNEATYNWIEADINNDDNNVYYTVNANEGAARTAYLKVYAPNDVYSDLITITQAAYVAPFEGATYTLASTITSGKHYIITNGENKAMGEQKANNRGAADVSISEGVATVSSPDVFEFVIYGPDADGYYTIFDANNGENGGYLYAASSSANYLRTEADINDNARWEITFNESIASIVAKGSSTHNVMQYNNSNSLFACYSSASQNAVYLYEKDGEAAPTGSVTVSPVSYATYSSENALNFSNTGITVYTAEANGTSVKLTEVSDGIVPAYTGVVLYANGGASATVPVATSKGSTTWTDNEMVANVKRAKVYLTEEGKTNYILSNEDEGIGFYLAAEAGAYLPAHRAYLSTTATGTGNAPFLGFDGNGTTAITDIQRSTLDAQQYYDLSGRRVAQPTKGLYIVNGKKVILK